MILLFSTVRRNSYETTIQFKMPQKKNAYTQFKCANERCEPENIRNFIKLYRAYQAREFFFLVFFFRHVNERLTRDNIWQICGKYTFKQNKQYKRNTCCVRMSRLFNACFTFIYVYACNVHTPDTLFFAFGEQTLAV